MSDYPMLISNKLHSFRNFGKQTYETIFEKQIIFIEIGSIIFDSWPFSVFVSRKKAHLSDAPSRHWGGGGQILRYIFFRSRNHSSSQQTATYPAERTTAAASGESFEASPPKKNSEV